MSTYSKWESPRINSGSELALRAENERLNRIAMEHYARLASEAQEEIARLQSGIAALRSDLINRRNVLVHRFRSVAAHQGAYMLPEIAVIEDVLRALGALVPGESEPTWPASAGFFSFRDTIFLALSRDSCDTAPVSWQYRQRRTGGKVMASFCTYCQQDFTASDKPVRANRGALGKWAHTGCKPASGSYTMAGWRVVVSESTNRNIPVGLTKQFVHEGKAWAYASQLEAFGGVTCTISEI